jgi:putative DNA primase/helicase
MAGKDETGKNAILNFLAQILQQPDKLVGMAILLYGEQGVGKDIIFKWFGNHILGEQQYYFVGNAKSLFGQFNSDFPSKTLIHCDELDKATVQKDGENLKRLITGDKIRSEGKGEKGKQVNSYNRYVMSTNNRDALKVEGTDRRYMVFETSSDHINNTQYFKTLIAYLEKQEVIRGFYDFLMARDISNFNSESRPKTKIYLEMKRASMDYVSKWISGDDKAVFEEPQRKATEWLNIFNNWAVRSGFYKLSITKFGGLVNALVDKNVGITRQKPNNVSHLTIDSNAFINYLEANDLLE